MKTFYSVKEEAMQVSDTDFIEASPTSNKAGTTPNNRRHHSLMIALLIGLAMTLGACATNYTSVNNTSPDQAKHSSDLSACRDHAIMNDEVKSAAGGLLVGAFYGAAEGAVIGAIHGGSAEGAVIGAAAGAVIGFVAGMASGNRDLDQCMAGRGWRPS